jgi:hypothetical protein
VTNDQHSRNDDPSLETSPRQGHTTKPDHPVMPRPGSQAAPGFPVAQVPTYPPQDSGGLPMAKTVVLPDADPAQGGAGPAQGGGRGLMHLFEDEDAPTFVYGENEQKPPQEVSAEASVLLVPDPNFGAAIAPAPPTAPAAPSPPWSQPQGPAPTAARPPQKKKSRALLVVGIVLGVLVVFGGAALGVSLFLFTGAERGAAVSVAASPPVAPRLGAREQGPTASGVAAPVAVPITPDAPTSSNADAPQATPPPLAEEAPSTERRAGDRTDLPPTTVPGPTPTPADPFANGVAAAPTTPTPALVPIEGELADQLTPLIDSVRECTRRESGYSPRALTVHLVPAGGQGARLRNVTPPTPPRVASCIARALEGVTWNAPAGIDHVSHTFDLRDDR